MFISYECSWCNGLFEMTEEILNDTGKNDLLCDFCKGKWDSVKFPNSDSS